MIKLKDIIAAKDALQKEISPLDLQKRRILLVERCKDTHGRFFEVPRPLDIGAITKAFASSLFVVFGLHHNLKEGLSFLEYASKIFLILAQENRLAAYFARDMENLKGNLHFSYLNYDEAIHHYQNALAQEKKPERRAICLLNMARVLIGSAKFISALECLEMVKIEHIVGPLLATTHLLRARILLVLGFSQLAFRNISFASSVKETNSQVDLECRYLMIYAEMKFSEKSKLQQDYASLATFLEKNGRVDQASFYTLEWMIISLVTNHESIKNKQIFLEKLRHLADRHQQQNLALLGKDLHEFIMNKGEFRKFERLGKSFKLLLKDGHYLLYQLLMAHFILVLLHRRYFDRALEFLTELETYHRETLSKIPPKLHDLLANEPNTIKGILSEIRNRLPASSIEKIDGLGLSIFKI